MRARVSVKSGSEGPADSTDEAVVPFRVREPDVLDDRHAERGKGRPLPRRREPQSWREIYDVAAAFRIGHSADRLLAFPITVQLEHGIPSAVRVSRRGIS